MIAAEATATFCPRRSWGLRNLVILKLSAGEGEAPVEPGLVAIPARREPRPPGFATASQACTVLPNWRRCPRGSVL